MLIGSWDDLPNVPNYVLYLVASVIPFAWSLFLLPYKYQFIALAIVPSHSYGHFGSDDYLF